MATIHKLPDAVIETIAAGQVIERPASVVKELVENSLDAKAKVVEIELKESGMRSISVIDDGVGMAKDDLIMCFLPHTTSKLEKLDDLHHLTTYGFRGEALASMAVSAQIEIQSRRGANQYGYSIRVEKGIASEIQPIGMPKGTIITVYNLFQSIPARKKFLKSPQTELSHCMQIIAEYSLAYPDIEFRLSHNGKRLYHVSKHVKYEKRVEMILGVSPQECFFVHEEHPYHTIHGYIVKPHQLHHSARKQFLFVNTRPVRHEGTNKVIKDMLRNLADPRIQPAYILHVTLPADHVDVNIHPRKEQISFHDEKGYEMIVRADIERAIQREFDKKSSSYDEFGMHGATADFIREGDAAWKPASDGDQKYVQLSNTYILMPTSKGMIYIDQHAAHERILFEQFRDEFIKRKQKPKIVKLAEPVQVDLGVLDDLIISHNLSILHDLGFKISKRGKSYTITHVPQYFQDRDLKKVLVEVLEDVEQGVNLEGVDSVAEKTIAYLACRSAVKAGDPLTLEQMKDLVLTLFNTKNYYTCPHGRPTYVLVKMDDLARMFKRK